MRERFPSRAANAARFPLATRLSPRPWMLLDTVTPRPAVLPGRGALRGGCFVFASGVRTPKWQYADYRSNGGRRTWGRESDWIGRVLRSGRVRPPGSRRTGGGVIAPTAPPLPDC